MCRTRFNYQSLALVPLLCVLVATLATATAVAQKAKRRPQLPEGVTLHADIPYAGTNNPRQTLDLLLPEKRKTDRPLPVIAFIHGGAWRAGHKNSARGRLARFVADGQFAGVSIGYRLSQEKIWPAQIHDCKAAIRWIRAHAKKHALAGDRIAVWGTSAGGHLVAMLGVSSGVKRLEGDLGPHTDQESSVRCVIDFFGPTDFLKMNDFPGRMNHNAADSPESKLVGGAIQKNKDAVRTANPLTYVTPGDAAFLIVHGSKDPLVPLSQSQILHTALKNAKVDSTLLTVDGAGHGFRSETVDRRVRAFLQKHLLGQKAELKDETIKDNGRPAKRRER